MGWFLVGVLIFEFDFKGSISRVRTYLLPEIAIREAVKADKEDLLLRFSHQVFVPYSGS